MRSRHLAMTLEEFRLLRLLEREPGWKYEYWNGRAHISPRHQVVTTSLNIEPRSCRYPCQIRPVEEKYEAELISAYLAAFRDTIEYCDWEEDKIADSARKSVVGFLGGERGKPLPASRLALVFHPETEERVVGGAALLVEMDDGCPLLDVLLVSPEWQRRGLATALVSSAIDQLHGSGYRRLTSRYMLGNDESEAWHGKFGFAAHPGRQPDWAAIVDPQPPGAGESGTGMEHGGGPLAGG